MTAIGPSTRWRVALLIAGDWGGPGWIPVPGDYDGDGKSDLAVYRAVTAIGPSTRWRVAYPLQRALGRAGLDPGARGL